MLGKQIKTVSYSVETLKKQEITMRYPHPSTPTCSLTFLINLDYFPSLASLHILTLLLLPFPSVVLRSTRSFALIFNFRKLLICEALRQALILKWSRKFYKP